MSSLLKLPNTVRISDITTRDGFQSECRVIPVESKLYIIHQLIDAGFREMEVSAFAPPRYQPQFRDLEEVARNLPNRDDVTYSFVTTGEKATQRAISAREKGYRVDRMVMGILPASEKLNQAIIGMTYDETWNWIEETIKVAHGLGMKVNIFLTGIFSPPDLQEKESDLLSRAIEFVDRSLQLGADDIEHPDHLGEAAPHQTYQYFQKIFERFPDPDLHVFHVHDARGMGLACYFAALQCGVIRFETTMGGLGGWPANFVNGSPVTGVKGLTEVSRRPGLVATEDFMVMLDSMGITSHIDLQKVMELGRVVEKIVDRQLWSFCLGTGERPGSGAVPKYQEYKTEKR